MNERIINSLAVTSFFVQLVSYFADCESFFNVLSFGLCIFTFGMIKGSKESKKYILYPVLGIILFIVKLAIALIMANNNMYI